MKTRTTTWLLATLILALLVPVTPANADGDETISLQVVGVTAPVPGETPVQEIETDEYTGTISWESIDGPLLGNFETETVYAATIELTLKTGFTFVGVGQDDYVIDGAFKVSNDADSGLITAFFAPPLLDATGSLDESFGDEGSIDIRDIFGDSPIDSSNTVVGPVKIDRIAVDSQNRIIVLSSFYSPNNQVTRVNGSIGTAIGTGYRNSINIAAQAGNTPFTSAADLAYDYVSTVNEILWDDWYLPAKDELNELYLQSMIVGGMEVSYWSSTQDDDDDSRAWSQDFFDGLQSQAEKSQEFAVRPIRAGGSDDPQLGETGEGGGVIFYVTDEAFTCGPELSDICNYLEAAPIDWNGGTGDPSRSWVADYENDNHILFRLNPDGSYDPEFGDEALYLRTDEDDEDLKPYALVTTTCSGYTERLDLAIDSLDRILVLLSGSAEENTCQGEFNNFVARFTATGALDMSFGDDSDGAIGTLNSQEGPAEDLFADLTLDAEGRIIVAALSEEDSARMGIVRFSQNGIVDLSFGNLGTSLINLYLPDDNAWLFYRSISMIANDDESYIIGFAGSTFENDSQSPIFYTQLLRLEQNGTLDEDFLLPEGISVAEGVFVLPYVFLTDLAPDSETGFIMSATAYPPIGGEGGFFEAASSVAFRIQMDGNFDAEFLGTPSDPNLAPLYSASCFNSVLLRDYLSHRSSDGIIVGNFCDDNVVPEEKYKLFSSTGVFQGQYSLNRAPELAEQVTNQLIQTSDDKVIVLSGLRPTTGIFGFMDAFGGFFDETDWTQSRITRYVFSNLSTPPTSNPLTITPSRATVNGQVGLAITPLDFTIAGGASADYARLSVNPALPAGLEFADGQIIGTPTAAGTTTVIFIVTDSEEGTTTATTTVQFVITLANQRPSTTSPSRVTGTVGTSLGNSVTLSLGGATSSETVTVTSGYALPAGLSLATNGRVTGTPSAAGTTSTRLTFTNTQSETATALIEFVIAPAYIPPSPVAYVRALTTPQIQLSSGKLLCAPGTYNAGYALEGVIMGSSTVLFSPTSFTYALLINGVKQSSSQISTAANSVFWDLPVSPSGTLFTCSVTVSYNGASTTNNSSDNSAAANTARTAQATSIANASTTYSSALVQNTKAYEKALKDNRSNWRAEMEKIKATYYAERDRIKALPASKETSAARSASLKTYLSAQKKSAVDYAASKPAALAAKDAADKAAMMAKDAAIAKANTTYANVIQSIGFGVLIP